MALRRFDVVGQRFGCFVVTDQYRVEKHKYGTRTYWLCRCDCGNEEYILRDSLFRNKHSYCEACKPTPIHKQHLYHILYGMKERCYNSNNPRYEHYGGKGIVICDEWNNSYDAFKKWAYEHGYRENAGLSIDRIDKNGNYCPENCEWVTIGENARRGNLNMVKNHSKLRDIYAISPDGNRINISNIAQFVRDAGLKKSRVHAILHGRCPNDYDGWVFHSEYTKGRKCNDYRNRECAEIAHLKESRVGSNPEARGV